MPRRRGRPQAGEEPLEQTPRREGHRAECLLRIEMPAPERQGQHLAQRKQQRSGEGGPARRAGPSRRQEPRRGSGPAACGAAAAPAARHAANTSVRSERAGSPASSCRPSARPRAAPHAGLPRRSTPCQVHGRRRAPGEPGRRRRGIHERRPKDSIIPENAYATPRRSRRASEISSLRARARAPKNAQSTWSR